MQALDAKDFHLVDYRGRGVLLNIFATWCGPCDDEEPLLVAAYAKYAARGLAIVGINNKEPDDTVRAFRKRYAIPYPIAMDRRGGFTRALEAGIDPSGSTPLLLPTTLFITPQGYLYCYLQGALGADELTYRIEKFLADAPPSPLPSPSAMPSA